MSVDTDKLADATDPILPIVSAPRTVHSGAASAPGAISTFGVTSGES